MEDGKGTGEADRKNRFAETSPFYENPMDGPVQVREDATPVKADADLRKTQHNAYELRHKYGASEGEERRTGS